LCIGWTNEDSPDEGRLEDLSIDMIVKISAASSKLYSFMKSSAIYFSSGTASDWFYSDEANINNEYRAASFTIELGGEEGFEFELPPSKVKIIELVDGIPNFSGTICR